MIEFDDLIHQCRDTRREARKATEGKDRLLDADVDEGVRIMARPGPACEAYAKSMEWWTRLEDRALGESKNGPKVNGNH